MDSLVGFSMVGEAGNNRVGEDVKESANRVQMNNELTAGRMIIGQETACNAGKYSPLGTGAVGDVVDFDGLREIVGSKMLSSSGRGTSFVLFLMKK